jgi:hypothetical protein
VAARSLLLQHLSPRRAARERRAAAPVPPRVGCPVDTPREPRRRAVGRGSSRCISRA